MKVPMLDLSRQYAGLKSEILARLEALFDSGQFILGPDLREFESEVAQYLEVKHAIGVTSGTDALWLALRALGVGQGDRVLTTPFTFFATVSAIRSTGAEPVFADILPDSYNVDPKEVEKVLASDREKKIKAFIPVHLYGQAAEMDSLSEICTRYHVPMIEDAAQAIGAHYHGKKAGNFGALACFSFFPTKNLGALGDAGLVTTNDDALAEKVKLLRVHGSKERYHHLTLGSNCRMDTMQAAALRVFLPHLNAWIAERQATAQYYDKRLGEYKEEFFVPARTAHANHTFHQYTIRVNRGKRDDLKKFLDGKGIANAVYYPIPCHLQEAIRTLGFKPGSYPVSERAAQEVISLPIFPGITDAERDAVLTALREWTTTV